MRAPYDEIADWYEHEFLGPLDARAADPLGISHCLRELLGEGSGPCLEIACGTGVHAATVAGLGWSPVGIDVSAGMLWHARGRLVIAMADAERLPVRDNALPAVISVMAHTDIPGYPAALREAARVLRPGGALVHVGVHPCFCGGFADRSDPAAILIGPGYRDGHWTKASWTDKGVRDKVGAAHFPLPGLLNAISDAGLVLERFAEGGAPTPMVLAVRARKPRPLPTGGMLVTPDAGTSRGGPMAARGSNEHEDGPQFHRDRREHGGAAQHLDDDRLAALAEEERVEAGLDDFDPDEVPPATDTPPEPTDIRETDVYEGERAELRRQIDEGEIREPSERDPFPPTRYDD